MAKRKSRRSSRSAGDGDGVYDITTYNAAIRYLLERTNVERMRAVSLDTKCFRLERTEALLDALDNPHEHLPCIHIAGTVGKGSTLAMIASMLQQCGYTVGTYTSPHLVDVRERIQINGRPITQRGFIELMNFVSDAAATLDFHPTFFEIMTAAALQHFCDLAPDMTVIETGLGGRLDSTNVIFPEVVAITRIDYDHTHILGNTLQEIAREKAGIFKPGVPVVSVEQQPEVEDVLRRKAAEVECPLRIVNKDIEFSYRFGVSPRDAKESRICLFTEVSRFEHVAVPLAGAHQALNCGLALAVIDTLREAGMELPARGVHEGLAATTLPGRMEIVWERPRVLVDGAHNPIAVRALIRSIGAHIPYDSLIVVFGCCEDKDVPAMLDQLALGGDKVIFTRASRNPRASEPEDLQRMYAERSGKMSQHAPTLEAALDIAQRAYGRDDLILITGSFYLVGDAKRLVAERAAQQSASTG